MSKFVKITFNFTHTTCCGAAKSSFEHKWQRFGGITVLGFFFFTGYKSLLEDIERMDGKK